MKTISDIRLNFISKYLNKDFVIDKTGSKTIEIIGESFVCDEDTIFGKVNQDYVDREIKWYLSLNQNLSTFPEPVPDLWKSVANENGDVNSNYGSLIFGENNGFQFLNVAYELEKNPNSRRAIMIYTSPNMHSKYNENGKNDFVCTNTVQFFIRNNELITYVQMRSNDAVYGFKNDLYWQKYVSNVMYETLSRGFNNTFGNLTKGPIYWNAGSLHVYENHFKLIEKKIAELEMD